MVILVHLFLELGTRSRNWKLLRWERLSIFLPEICSDIRVILKDCLFSFFCASQQLVINWCLVCDWCRTGLLFGWRYHCKITKPRATWVASSGNTHHSKKYYIKIIALNLHMLKCFPLHMFYCINCDIFFLAIFMM